jgi:hypothetical protein
MHHRQITSPERYLISSLRQWGFTPAQTATVPSGIAARSPGR